jgi:hypothetical protein
VRKREATAAAPAPAPATTPTTCAHTNTLIARITKPRAPINPTQPHSHPWVYARKEQALWFLCNGEPEPVTAKDALSAITSAKGASPPNKIPKDLLCPIRCPECGEQYANAASVAAHAWSEHGDECDVEEWDAVNDLYARSSGEERVAGSWDQAVDR